MQIGFGSKDRRRSPNKQGSGGYYQFTFEEDLSGSEDDGTLDLSPQEMVARALRDTDLGSHPAVNLENAVPEPDFSYDFLEELDDIPEVRDDRFRSTCPQGDNDQSCDVSDGTDDDHRPETPESLHSPLDHPDSGYIEFVHPQSRSSLGSDHTRSPSDAYDDDFHVPRSRNSNLSDCSGDSSSSSRQRSLSPSSPKNKQTVSLPQVVFHRFKSEFSRLEEDRFIDDDILQSDLPFDPSTMNVELQDLGGKESGAPLRGPHDESKTGGSYLPMPGEMTLEHEQDAMLDLDRSTTEADDVRPIIFVEQASLADRHRARKKKVTIVVAVVAAVFGLAALGAITYLLVRFLNVIES